MLILKVHSLAQGYSGISMQLLERVIWHLDNDIIPCVPEQGSVGPHLDEYDVFLLQAEGRRRWQYTNKRIEAPRLIPDLELAILSEFGPDQDEILNPGDMLYLPPGCAHHGVALEPYLIDLTTR